MEWVVFFLNFRACMSSIEKLQISDYLVFQTILEYQYLLSSIFAICYAWQNNFLFVVLNIVLI